MSDSVRRHDADGVTTVTFTRDDKMNAINPEMFGALQQAVADLEADDAHRVLVIRAEGRFFTSGVDIKGMRGNLGVGTDGSKRDSNMRFQYRTDALHDFFDDMEQVEKPIVLAAHSHCWGVGVEFGSSCDFRFASEATTFGLPEIPNLAMIPGSGGISRLTRLVGPHWAKWIAMAGETVDAETARMMGYVHAVYPVEEFDAKVDEFVAKLVGLPREATGVAKIAIDAAHGADRRTARQFDRLTQSVLYDSAEVAEKMAAFATRKRS